MKLPTLLIWGQQDRILVGQLDFFKQFMPGQFERQEPPHFTHSPYLEGEMDRELAQMMQRWVEQRFLAP